MPEHVHQLKSAPCLAGPNPVFEEVFAVCTNVGLVVTSGREGDFEYEPNFNRRVT